jgi:DDE superfamily endonuclease
MKPRKERKGKFNRLDYCQFLLASQVNYTMTYLADHSEWSHDAVRRYLLREGLSAKEVWEHSRSLLSQTCKGYLVFDDFLLDKDYSYDIELVRHQYSGKEKRQMNGIAIVTCVYVNPETEEYWLIDYRIYHPETDGKTKLDHAREMFEHAVVHKQLEFSYVAFDAWYAEMTFLKLIETYQKIYQCPVKGDRKVCDQMYFEPGQPASYQQVADLFFDEHELEGGKLVHLHKFPKGHLVRLFRLVLSDQRTDFLITNEVRQQTASEIQQGYTCRWKIDQFHREVQQTTGIDQAQACKARIQRNHIACAFLVWTRLTFLARQLHTSIYALKQSLLGDYMKQQLRSPVLHMDFA